MRPSGNSALAKVEFLSEADMREIDNRQRKQQQEWRLCPEGGYYVTFRGRNLVVHRNVFPPKGDTELLARTIRMNSTHRVLDIGTGTGALAIYAADCGANNVVAVDINNAAVNNTRANIHACGLSNTVAVRKSNVFQNLTSDAKFHVIMANLPGRKKVAPDIVASAQWDTDFTAHRALFSGAKHYLQREGSIYMVKANYPDLAEMITLASEFGLRTKILSKKAMGGDDPRIYFTLCLSLKS